MAEPQDNTQPPIDQDFQRILQQAATTTEKIEGLGKEFPYPVRTVTGVKPGLEPIAFPDIKRTGGVDRPMRYGGHLLVDQNGNVARSPYDPVKESRIELTKIAGTAAGASLLNLLASRGYYGVNGKPSATALAGTRLESKDLQAMEDLLYYANSRGSTWEPLVAELAVMPAMQGTGGGSRVRVTSAEDLGVYLREESFRQLGRNLTRGELQQAIANIQNQQRQRAASAQDAPSLQTAAQMQVAGVDPNRAAAMRLGRALELLVSGQ
jgi:hypothetical protein